MGNCGSRTHTDGSLQIWNNPVNGKLKLCTLALSEFESNKYYDEMRAQSLAWIDYDAEIASWEVL